MKDKKNDKILTLHPQGKKGVNISLHKYEQIKNFILQTIKKKGVITFKELSDTAVKKLTGKFDGKVLWYVVTVILDLEARNFLEKIPDSNPQKIKLK